MSISLKEIAERIGADMISAPDALQNALVTGINSPQNASSSEITFVSSEAYLSELDGSEAIAVVIHPDLAEKSAIPVLPHPQPYIAYAKMSALFSPNLCSGEIHSTAVVSGEVTVGADVSIGANSVIEVGAKIGAGVSIGSNVSIGKNVTIGDGTQIYPNVSVYHDVSIGSDCIVHSGTVIGSDGFGFAPSSEGWVKIHQLGSVRVGNHVEIGSNCSIDRGALEDTVIRDGVKIDNLVHMAHNVEIGENTAIAGQTGIAGSTKIGKNCMFGGQVGVSGHIEITDSVSVTGQGMITKSIKKPGVYSSGTSFSESGHWRKNAVRFQQLDSLFRRLTKLEKKLGTDK